MKKQYKLGIALMGDHVNMISQIGWDAFFTGWDRNNIERWANEAARNGLIYQSIHSPFSHDHKVSYMWQDREEGKFVTDQLIECVKDCARFDIPVMVIHPFIGFKEHTPTQIGLDNYARVIEVANKLGVTLGFENVEGEEYLAALMEKFWNEPSCGFCLDTGHLQLLCKNIRTYIPILGKRIKALHIHDNDGMADAHLAPYTGSIDWKAFYKSLREIGYDGDLDFETFAQTRAARLDAELVPSYLKLIADCGVFFRKKITE